MKAIELFSLIGSADEQLLAETAPQDKHTRLISEETRKTKADWRGWAAVAACAALVAGTLWLGVKTNLFRPETQTPAVQGSENVGVTAANTEKVEEETNTPTHIYEKVGETLTVDVELPVLSGELPKIYTASLPVIDEEIAGRFLTEIGDSIARENNIRVDDEETDEIEGQNMFVRSFETEKDAYFAFTHSTEESDIPWYNLSYNIPEYGIYRDTLWDYYSIDRSVASWDNTHRYKDPKEFSFCTEQDAVAAAKKLLNTLGIKDMVCTETLYLDHAAMETYLRTERAQDLLLERTQELLQEGWDASKDAYYLRFSLMKEGVSAVDVLYSTDGGVADRASSYIVDCYAIWNASGLVCLTIENPWQFGEAVETPAQLIPASAAVEKARTAELERDTDLVRVIDGIRLQYCYNAELKQMRPCWSVTVLNKDAIVTPEIVEDLHTRYLFDAVTGELIP